MESEHRVSTLELFFDLVFVFTITQLTVLLADDLTLRGAGRVLLIFTVLFWMYGGYAYLTNQVPPDRPVRRLLILLAMGAFLVCALAVPTAFGDGGVAFGLGYLVVVITHSALYSQAHGRGVLWFAMPNALSALSVTAAGLLDGAAALGLWGLALLFQFVTPAISRRATASGPESAEGKTIEEQLGGIGAAHFVERHGLLLIIVFGESIIAVGIGVGSLPLTFGIVVGAFLTLAVGAALWWMYFVRDEGRAEHVFASTTPDRRFKLALRAYYYCFIPMLLGIAAFSAGVKKSIGHLGEQLPAGPALALAGGVACYLAGDVAFRVVLGIRPVRFRALAVVPVLATAAAGMRIGAAWQLTALVLVLVAALAAEARAAGAVVTPVVTPAVTGTTAGPEPATGAAACSGPGVTGS
ncbi:low temperature requirement protein A [Streptomyces sp. NBC_01264]|uniref:low temperature requirement protein A n=1 Tax=Streptomyces sp. NBC_01264 TaxID=2903804 RepID=UPI0022540F4C|nr:low temperature requirement protein A [Streptomyces sp. NBC_01264]MCX4782857.1 low temperature requirement protein A [Streptomyces sp. NBC_01264]